MFQMMAYVTVVFKNVLYNLKSLFWKGKKNRVNEDTIRTSVSNLTWGGRKIYGSQ